MNKVFVYDKTASDKHNSFRGIGRFLQILKENFPEWSYINDLSIEKFDSESVFINPFLNFLQPPLTFKRIAKKQIAVIHDLIPLKYPSHFPAGIRGNFNILLNRLVLRNYDVIVAVSDTVKKDIIKILNIPENKIQVIYQCLPKIFSTNHKASNMKNINTKYKILDTKYCIYVGDATWNKNIVNLARAIKLADVSCIFAGKVFEIIKNQSFPDLSSPWLEELRQFIVETKDDKHFIFPGYVSDLELVKLYKQADFNILPSKDEGFGFSWLESASLNCPSLLSNIPVFREISDNNALFFNPLNPKDIAEKIQTLMKSRSLRQELGKATLKRSYFFSPEKFKKEFTIALT